MLRDLMEAALMPFYAQGPAPEKTLSKLLEMGADLEMPIDLEDRRNTCGDVDNAEDVNEAVGEQDSDDSEDGEDDDVYCPSLWRIFIYWLFNNNQQNVYWATSSETLDHVKAVKYLLQTGADPNLEFEAWELHPESLQAWQELEEQQRSDNFGSKGEERSDKMKKSQEIRDQIVQIWETILKDAGLHEATVLPAWQAFELASSLFRTEARFPPNPRYNADSLSQLAVVLKAAAQATRAENEKAA